MADTVLNGITDRQQRWFASVRAGLATQTGRTIEQWALIARACPETAHRKRLAWLKQNHGLGQNHASLVLHAAFPAGQDSSPDALADTLWNNPAARAILHRVRLLATSLPDVIVGQRRGFTSFSRTVQFAAARPARATLRLGLALPSDHHPRLTPPGRYSWSERLHATLLLETPEQADDHLASLLRAAWEKS